MICTDTNDFTLITELKPFSLIQKTLQKIILHLSEFKAVADDKSNVTQLMQHNC